MTDPHAEVSAAPVRSRQVLLVAAVTGGVVVLIALVVAACLAFGPRVLSGAAVQRDVGTQFGQREGVAVELICPSTMPVRRGATYTCTGTTADGEAVTVRITVTDERSAAYTWSEP